MALIKTTLNANRNDPRVTEVYLTNVSTIYQEIRAFIGGVQVVGGVLQYVPPAIHTDSGLVCLTADAEIDYQAGGDIDSADICTLTVSYGIPEIDDNSTEFGSLAVDLGGSLLQLEKGAFEFNEGSKSGEELGENDLKPFKVVPEANLTIVNKFKTYDPTVALLSYYGKVNNAGTTLINTTFGTEKLRFDGVSTDTTFSTDGYQYYQVTYKFAANPFGWNKVWDGSAYSAVTPKIYETADLSGILYV